MTKTTEAIETTATPCECSRYDAVPGDLSEKQIADGDYPIWNTGCTATTKREFAPGHDAKLKSALIAWGAIDADVRRGIEHDSAQGWAKRYTFGYMITEGIEKAKAKLAAKAEREAARKAKKDAKGKPAERKLAEGAGVVKLADVVADEEAAHAEAEARKVAEREQSAEWDDAPATPILEDEAAMNTRAREERERDEVQAKIGRWTYKGIVSEDGTFSYRTPKGELKTASEGKYKLV
ncbi:hypothetical protein HOU95_gp057 [Streptomyces phage Hiyaa]|uniref:Uncharacterized protein n=1 Tax=Streptomyces phage Hiyaa TaxID=2499072 RepID=A0A3S9U910_9CAUD|nr:hypothetical protein HOU95_gp057 [Streptomyces phage Hiyaa]AZS06750.1 hypothetical protein SEA_HIYAA_111 [Streptomyces phage Hiyaa]